MQIKASNQDFSVHIASGLFPLEAIDAIRKHCKDIGDRVWVEFVTYERVA